MSDPQTTEALESKPCVVAVEIQRRFATPFLVMAVGNANVLNDDLRGVILARAAADPGVQRSNNGGWQSDDDFADWSGPAGKALLALAQETANSLTAVQTDGRLLRVAPEWKVNAWANINRAGHGNSVHHHPAAFWSGVYWVDAGSAEDGSASGGEFEMHDPRGILPAFYAPRLRYAIEGCLSAGGQDFFTPSSGVMVLFPAWLVHAVRPYAGDGVRISVAFNLSV